MFPEVGMPMLGKVIIGIGKLDVNIPTPAGLPGFPHIPKIMVD